jgi:hypothetical protein
MSKIHVKRIITIEYEYPFDEAHTNGDSFSEMVDHEKDGCMVKDTIIDCIREGEYVEDVEVTLVSEPSDNLPPANGISFNLQKVMSFVWGSQGRNDPWDLALQDTFKYLSELGNKHGFYVPLEGVRESLLQMANIRSDRYGLEYLHAVKLVVEFLNSTEEHWSGI